ncbi:multidrug resistance-associated protein 1-like isoform X2 [Amblyomma americanum]
MSCGVSAVLKASAAACLVAAGWAELLRRQTAVAGRTRGATLVDLAHLVLTLASAISYSIRLLAYSLEERCICADAASDLLMSIALLLLFALSLYRFLTAQYTSGLVLVVLIAFALAAITEYLVTQSQIFQEKYKVPEEEEAKSPIGVLFGSNMYRSLKTIIVSKAADIKQFPKVSKRMLCAPATKEAFDWPVEGRRAERASHFTRSVFRLVWVDAFWVIMTHLGYYACLTARTLLLESLIAGTGHLSSTVVLFVATCVGEAALTCYMNHLCSAFSERFQVLMQGVVFARMLRHSATARQANPPAYVMSVFGVDCTTLSFGVTLIPMPAAGIFVLPLVFYMLFRRVGLEASLACAAWLLLTMVALCFALARLRTIERTSLKQRDERLRRMLELLNSIRTLKMYAWERGHARTLGLLRGQELRCVLQVDVICGVLEALTGAASSLLTIIMYGTLWILDSAQVLSASASFSSVYLLSLIEAFLNSLPLLMIMANRMTFAMSRVMKLCCAEEMEWDEPDTAPEKNREAGEVVLDKCSFARATMRSGSLALRDITLAVEPGSLVGIAGPVGSGKSTLLRAILGELHTVQGSLVVKGKVAYVPQVACVFNMTLRDNVLFGKEYDPNRYQRVLEACDLARDLSMFPAGDLTEIGEKGYNLSGGQKQRVSLARAVYQDSSVYVLDDPLSALDVNVSTAVFNRLLGRNGLLSNKTRLIVTSQVRLLEHMDFVFFMCGKTGVALRKPVALYHNGKNNNQSPRGDFFSSSDLDGSRSHDERSREDVLKGRLVEDENTESSKKIWEVAWPSVKSCGVGVVPAVLLLATSAVAASWQLVWIKRWTEAGKSDPAWVWGLALLSIGAVSSRVVGNVLVAVGANRLSRLLHRDMLERVLRSPVSFFDATPRGRILNRFTADASTLDTRLASYSRQTAQSALLALARAAAIGTERLSLLAVSAVVAAVFAVGMRFLPQAVNAARFAKNAHLSRVLQHVNEAAESLSVVRAHGATRRFLARFCRLADDYLRLCLASVSCVRLTRAYSAACGLAVVVITLAFAVEEESSSAMGLMLNSSLAIPIIMTSLCTALLGLSQIMVALERQLEYAELPDEEDTEVTEHNERRAVPRVEKSSVQVSWPTQGRIEFQDFCASYKPAKLDDCLSHITFTVQPREKVGVVGRTGAGKSSMVLALLRVLKATRGRILVDGIDVASVPLQTLRTAITVIPQDPCLVDGTLRGNLDPRERHSDQELWRVLQQAHMAHFVRLHPDGLLLRTGPGGERLSVGQRQLVCLARALLRRPRILVLDEATSQMDGDTDNLIQATLRESFAHSTVLTVAHRIHTVLDYDRILVMSAGKILEEGRVQDLLHDTSSAFFMMAKSASLSEFQEDFAEENTAAVDVTRL